MMGKTHKVIALTGASFIYDLSFSSIISVVTILITATMPDIDVFLGKRYHRKFTHSFLCLSILATFAWGLYEPLGMAVIIGYGSHILADSFTRMGVAAFYPNKKMVGLKIITTGSAADWFIFWSCLGYIFIRYK